MSNIGVINEIGDMGFGFTELNQKDQQTLQESSKNNSNENNCPKINIDMTNRTKAVLTV